MGKKEISGEKRGGRCGGVVRGDNSISVLV